MLENMGARISSRARISVCRARAIRPLPSRNGWTITRLRCAIAARTSTGLSLPSSSSIIAAISSGTPSAGGPSYVCSPVDHHEIEVRHRRTDQHRAIATFQLLDHRGDQLWYAIGRRPFIRLLAGGLSPDIDVPRAPAAWVLIQAGLEHHEVEGLKKARIPLRTRVLRDLKHVRHRVAVAIQGQPRLFVGAQGRLIINRGDNIVEARVVALDAVGTLHGASKRHSAERAVPAARLKVDVVA